MRTRNSIRGFVCPSFCPSIGLSVRPSVGPSVTHESKSGKMSVLEAVLERGLGGGWVWMGVGRPCPPIYNNIVTPCLCKILADSAQWVLRKINLFFKKGYLTRYFFLVADKQIHKRLCPSVYWSIGPLVH